MKKNLKNRGEVQRIRIPRTSYLVLLTLLIFVACTQNQKHADHQDTYTCPMHPTVVADKPGTCPVCGMDLVRKARPGEEIKITEDLAKLIKSPNESVVSSIQVVKGEFRTLPVSVDAQGIITYDTRNIYTIPTRIGGRLEKVFLKFTFQPVRKGQKVAEIYSPELLTAQRELLYLLENDPSNTGIIESAKNKLYLLGATQGQVNDLIKRKEILTTFAIYSPYDGYVIAEAQTVPSVSATSSSSASSSSSGMGGSMGEASTAGASSTPNMNTSTTDFIREGNYVAAGQTLFKVASASALRVELNIPITQGGRIALNDEIDLSINEAKSIKGKVDFIQPFFTDGEEFVKVRLYVKNNNDLRIGQFVQATIHLKSVEALWVPRAAVLDLGLNKIVFIKERGVFKPKNIQPGVLSSEWLEIKQGLSSSDEIASNAQYMVDSESFIKTK